MQESDDKKIRKAEIKKALLNKFIENEDLINVDFKLNHEHKKLTKKKRVEMKLMRSILGGCLEPKNDQEIKQELMDLEKNFTSGVKQHFKSLLKDISLNTKIFDWKMEIKIINNTPAGNGLSIVVVPTSGGPASRKDNNISYFRLKLSSKNRKVSGEFFVVNEFKDDGDIDNAFLESTSFFYKNGFKPGLMGSFWSFFSSQAKKSKGLFVYNQKIEDNKPIKSSFSSAIKKIMDLDIFELSRKTRYIRIIISNSIEYCISKNYSAEDFDMYLGYSNIIEPKEHYDEKDILRFLIDISYIKYDGTKNDLDEIFKGDFKEIINILNLYNY